MTRDYLVFSSREEAEERSRQAWVDKMGRPKRPEDVTEFLWEVVESAAGQRGGSSEFGVVVDSHEELLRPEDTVAESFERAEPISQPHRQPPPPPPSIPPGSKPGER